MERDRTHFLMDWLNSKNRKPLVIRGARQVGKTWLVRNLADKTKMKLIEINFERRPDLESLFSSNDPKEIIINIAALFRQDIEAKDTILFLDEIQVAPKLLSKLRWFAEEMPELAVIAAGSLLDFALVDHEFSMPVGRIGYMYLEPLSFEEFIMAQNYSSLKKYILSFDLEKDIPKSIHEQLTGLVKEYLLIGGMPAAVSAWVNEKDLKTINQIHFDLITTYREDFSKYQGRLATARLEEVFASIPLQLGQKFVYSQASETNSTSSKRALELLVKACICHQIFCTSSNGLPLNAEINEKYFKVILLDCGLVNATLGLSLQQISLVSDLILVNKGGVAEQLAGQQLRTLFPPYAPPYLNYWMRIGKGSANAEIDYVIQYENKIIPVEVKAGSTGGLKSLHEFMFLKKLNLAVRINSDYPSIVAVEVKTAEGNLVKYTLLSIPFYLVGQLNRLLKTSTL